MKTGIVIGNVWATRKEEALAGLKLLVVQPIDISNGKNIESPIVAADTIGAGVNETVLYVSGSTARVSIGQGGAPVDATVVGIIDDKDII